MGNLDVQHLPGSLLVNPGELDWVVHDGCPAAYLAS
jgi:hypothetical protein